ncbi:MAG: hypothetical protein VX486_08045 [Pseudomonadota bacterium]|nr:hypothetical protein [Pseudomonadota bacterium]
MTVASGRDLTHDLGPGLEVLHAEVAVSGFGFSHGGIRYLAVVVPGQQQRIVWQRL